MSSNEFYVNYLTHTYSGLVSSQTAGTQTKGMAGFMDYVSVSKQKTETAKEAEGMVNDTEKIGRQLIERMSLEEYKQYIYDQISRIPFHPSQILRSVSINITDEVFLAMQNDPEYEKWVLDILKNDFSFYDPWSSICGGSFAIHHFGASKEEYHGEGWYTGFQGGKGSALFDEEADEGFWERRAKRHKKYLEQQKESDDKKRIMKRVYQEAAMRRGDYKNMFHENGFVPMLSLINLLSVEEEKN